MLCPACDEYRFPRQSTTSVNRANDNAKDIEKARDNDKGIPEDTQQLTGRQRHQHPQSAPSKKCGECRSNVSGKDKAVQCEACDVWHHAKCCSIPDSVYDFLGSQEGRGIHWFCKNCDKAAGKILLRMSEMQAKQDRMEQTCLRLKTSSTRSEWI